jgi:hypothetical protein
MSLDQAGARRSEGEREDEAKRRRLSGQRLQSGVSVGPEMLEGERSRELPSEPYQQQQYNMSGSKISPTRPRTLMAPPSQVQFLPSRSDTGTMNLPGFEQGHASSAVPPSRSTGILNLLLHNNPSAPITSDRPVNNARPTPSLFLPPITTMASSPALPPLTYRPREMSSDHGNVLPSIETITSVAQTSDSSSRSRPPMPLPSPFSTAPYAQARSFASQPIQEPLALGHRPEQEEYHFRSSHEDDGSFQNVSAQPRLSVDSIEARRQQVSSRGEGGSRRGPVQAFMQNPNTTPTRGPEPFLEKDQAWFMMARDDIKDTHEWTVDRMSGYRDGYDDAVEAVKGGAVGVNGRTCKSDELVFSTTLTHGRSPARLLATRRSESVTTRGQDCKRSRNSPSERSHPLGSS